MIEKDKKLPADGTQESVFGVLYDVARLFRRDFHRRSRAHGTTRAQWQVLATLARHQGIRQINLADLLEIEPITLVRHLDRLEEAGLVERRPDPYDRRARTLHLTDAAAPVLTQIRAVARLSHDLGLNGLSAAEEAELLRLLTQIRKNFVERSSGNGTQSETGEDKGLSHG